jgi:hypothetical protein
MKLRESSLAECTGPYSLESTKGNEFSSTLLRTTVPVSSLPSSPSLPSPARGRAGTSSPAVNTTIHRTIRPAEHWLWVEHTAYYIELVPFTTTNVPSYVAVLHFSAGGHRVLGRGGMTGNLPLRGRGDLAIVK